MLAIPSELTVKDTLRRQLSIRPFRSKFILDGQTFIQAIASTFQKDYLSLICYVYFNCVQFLNKSFMHCARGSPNAFKIKPCAFTLRYSYFKV